jgi:DNA-directed RNA polymerase subunit M/transcription elongation factor TFIIS
MSELRDHVRDEFTDIFTTASIAINLEKAIFNFAIRKTKEMNRQNPAIGLPSWENTKFVENYKRKFLNLKFNINYPDNDLKQKIQKMTPLQIHILPNQTPAELCPNGPYARMYKEKLEKEITAELKKAQMDESKCGLFTCSKCKSKKTTYYELQTRSADEPMTAFISCLDCGKRWKS